MYPGVPCYNLAQLHRAIKDDMPECPRGLLETWRVILEIQRRQELDPKYWPGQSAHPNQSECGTQPNQQAEE
jgi:fatty acid desaturase